jgi:hypothetical protein
MRQRTGEAAELGLERGPEVSTNARTWDALRPLGSPYEAKSTCISRTSKPQVVGSGGLSIFGTSGQSKRGSCGADCGTATSAGIRSIVASSVSTRRPRRRATTDAPMWTLLDHRLIPRAAQAPQLRASLEEWLS